MGEKSCLPLCKLPKEAQKGAQETLAPLSSSLGYTAPLAHTSGRSTSPSTNYQVIRSLWMILVPNFLLTWNLQQGPQGCLLSAH